MEFIPSDKVVNTIREHIDKIGVKLPLKSDDELQDVIGYFCDLEGDLSNWMCSGYEIDRKLLDDAADVVTEMILNDVNDYIDLDKLNKRLMNIDGKS